MDWKSFFRPTLAKIIVAVMIILVFVPFIHYDNGVRCIQAPCSSQGLGSIATAVFFTWDFGLQIYSISYFNLVAGIVLAYLVSCSSVFLLNRIKKR